MNYLKISRYIYLAFGFVLLYLSITQWNEDPKPWLTIILAALAFFTFFFRGRFSKRFEDQNKRNPDNQNQP